MVANVINGKYVSGYSSSYKLSKSATGFVATNLTVYNCDIDGVRDGPRYQMDDYKGEVSVTGLFNRKYHIEITFADGKNYNGPTYTKG